jgi:hypothetical protein
MKMMEVRGGAALPRLAGAEKSAILPFAQNRNFPGFPESGPGFCSIIPKFRVL